MSVDVLETAPTRMPPASRPGSGWRVVGGAFALLLLVSGILSAASWLAYQTETQDQVYPQPAGHIELVLGTGDITILPGDEGVRVHRRLTWAWIKPTITETWEGNTLRVTTHCPPVQLGPGCGVDYTLRVPAEASLTVRTSTGDVTIRGITGDLALVTSTGDIRVTDARGTLSVNANTGDITGTGLRSPEVEAKSSTGDVNLTFTTAPDRVDVVTNTGDVRIAVPDGDAYQVTASSSHGDESVRVAQDPRSPRTIRARASTGDVRVVPT